MRLIGCCRSAASPGGLPTKLTPKKSCCHKYKLYEIQPIQRSGLNSRILPCMVLGCSTVESMSSGIVTACKVEKNGKRVVRRPISMATKIGKDQAGMYRLAA